MPLIAPPFLQHYHSGVMTAACGAKLDHGVLAVGYGSEGVHDFYKIKVQPRSEHAAAALCRAPTLSTHPPQNSWGADWGARGYIMLGRGGAFSAAGQCGVQSDASYPRA